MSPDNLPVVEPRLNCERFFGKVSLEAVLLTRKEFDKFYRAKRFSDGPHSEAFGDGMGDPYNPYRQGFGVLKDGRGVYCEMHKSMQEKAKAVLNGENK